MSPADRLVEAGARAAFAAFPAGDAPILPMEWARLPPEARATYYAIAQLVIDVAGDLDLAAIALWARESHPSNLRTFKGTGSRWLTEMADRRTLCAAALAGVQAAGWTATRAAA